MRDQNGIIAGGESLVSCRRLQRRELPERRFRSLTSRG
jgi:hypothetical protein